MLTVIIPGYSEKNKIWLTDAAREIGMEHDVRPIFWNHWEGYNHLNYGSQKFNAKDKSVALMDIAGESSVNIVAKSIGSLVASYMIRQSPEKFTKVVFCGIPFNDLEEGDLEVYHDAISLLTEDNFLCLQNESDPHGDFEQARGFIHKINPKLKVIQKDRTDHEYPYYSEIETFLKE